ncbi:cold-responsive protein kinase 1 isoform X1 [Daucus carota subsp. sativus]|uniref:cold-responsive protein kinase 1 isoform X1 n=1 Tax=Daucus carota subsp. sativus TaxID=79200 RepID=UPI0007EF09E5|nr:PREDICTED: cysteine-rich receptor-like protein kinase 2 isoform X1 [Daucus carota subsp. sativus]XP_017230547.1 PREDICTED: cysteine-rich receptor-like protein kinase 2 isoform X1 [Daucus carota subsp. sativus]
MKQWWKMIAVVVLAVTLLIELAMSDPQANKISQPGRECSGFDAANPSEYFRNLNSTFADLRRQLSVEKKHFATAEQASTVANNVYTLFQCRDYLSTADCVACFDIAKVEARKICKLNHGARVIYDGCFLRYEVRTFYTETELGLSSEVCRGKGTVPAETAFKLVAVQLLKDLADATPKLKSYFAVAKRQVFDGGPSAKASVTVYALAQCTGTVSQGDCGKCLMGGYSNIQACLPQPGGSSAAGGCFMRYSVTPFFADNDITNIMPHVEGGRSSKKTAMFAGGVGVISLLFLIIALLLWYQLSRKRKPANTGDIREVNKLQGPTIYRYKDLKSATKNFSEECKVGEGGFGDVYKGIISNGTIVAVKKLVVRTSKEMAAFESEVRLISDVHHRNIVRLLGCSGTGPVQLLVYEYMENGSLDTFLYGDKRGTLSWKKRVGIILGIARGLAYLHEQFHVCIIHRDMKSSNVLLDDDFQPQIADFGLARLLPTDQSHLTTRYAGTVGYTAPEYAIHGHLSEKVDTYGFGIVVLEVISGRRCNHMKNELVTQSLLEHAWKSYNNGTHEDLIDETIDSGEYNVENAKKMIEIALKCTQSPVSLRPTMSEVVVMLMNYASSEPKQINKGPVE